MAYVSTLVRIQSAFEKAGILFQEDNAAGGIGVRLTFFKDGFFYPGDLAVMRSDGRMALQGRITDVIVVQGYKISPAPIEDRLGELLGVNGVCLFSMQDDSGEEGIHVVVETPTPIDSERLIAAINQELRGFPRARVHFAAVLPCNQMGKVLRQEVRAQAIASQPPFAGTG